MQINRYWYWDPFCVEEETHIQSNHTKWITEVLNNLQKLGNAFYNRNEITARRRNPIMLRGVLCARFKSLIWTGKLALQLTIDVMLWDSAYLSVERNTPTKIISDFFHFSLKRSDAIFSIPSVGVLP